ncbi:MFS-type transporter involved in bile tolerance (Atg22 family) [Micromonospora pisi]|uniref:MFS-type transporter involved in bile tolerance (Atg22 family) n=1 Tax=Micromonospora pisi TaxID=589240 RepID=A0A495JMG8_9ACTN|nr:MFS transporter [Micromonospora pisi]RKR89229.1 MFS-type transporter involved in bile tolerance (Atg22 family) [Micromonospora pisi]
MTGPETITTDGVRDDPGVRQPFGAAYRRLWSAAVTSRFGDAVRTPALALLAASLTRDPRLVAGVVVAGQLPPLLLGLLAGVYADRWDRRRTMATVDGARCAVVAVLALLVLTGHVGIGALAAAAFLLAALGALFDAAAFAVLPAVVPAGLLPAANGRLAAGTAVAGGFVGAPVAGLLFATSAALPFAVDAATFAVAALLALTLPSARPARHVTPVTVHHRPSVWQAAGDGLRWIRRDRVLLRITLLTAASNLAISGLIAVLVLYALEVLGVTEAGYGALMASAMLGGLAGGLGAGRLATRLGTRTGLRWVLVAQTLALVTLAVSRHPVPGGIALAVFSAGSTTWNALWSAYGQRNVPAELLGRVGSAQRVVGLVAAPVGAALAGLTANMYGLPPVGYAAAVVFAVVTSAAWRVLGGNARSTQQPEDPAGVVLRDARHQFPVGKVAVEQAQRPGDE